MESKPDTIHITSSHREEIFATHADLFVTVRGSFLRRRTPRWSESTGMSA